MRDASRRPSIMVFGCLILAVLGGSLPVYAGQSAEIIHRGSFSADQLSWSVSTEGTYVPILAGVEPLTETDKPILASQRLQLLVPVESRIVGVEVVPLATQQLEAPGALSLGGLLYDGAGKGCPTGHLELGEAAYPLLWGEYAGSHVWRGFRLVAVQLYPLRALKDDSGAWTTVEMLGEYAIRLLTDQRADLPAVVTRQRQVPGERRRLNSQLQQIVANPEALAGYWRQDGVVVAEPKGGYEPEMTPSLNGNAVRFLIITNAAMETAFQALADHKTSLGMPAVVRSREWVEANYRNGCDIQETIRLFIREAYERWGVEYVLLGGDTDVIPARYIHSNYQGEAEVPADLYFACLEGNWNANGDAKFGEPYDGVFYPGDDCDMADEVYVGRAPVSDAAAATVFTDKVITYENVAAGSDWAGRTLFAAEVLFPSDYNTGDPIDLDGSAYAEEAINNFIVPCTGITPARMYEAFDLWPGSQPLTNAQFTDSLNSGRFGIIDQIGHGFFFNMSVGDENFLVTDADALVNGDNLFVLYSVNCASAAFDRSCLMERFIQNANGGSVISIGSSRASYPLNANNYQQEFTYQLYCQPAYRIGDLVSLSRAPFVGSTWSNTVDRWTFFNYTLLGDPSLPVWSEAPVSPTVSAPGSLNTGDQMVLVNVTDGVTPLENIVVCLAKDGEDYIYEVTDSNGDVNLSFTPVSDGDAVLTVSGPNLELTQTVIPVAVGGGAYIAMSQMTVVDDGSDGSSGNGNGLLEAGETVALWLRVVDNGSGGATGCSATLTCGTGGVTVLDGSANLGTVPSGGIKDATDPFLLQLDAAITDGHLLDCQVVVSDDSKTDFESEWHEHVLAPEIEVIELTWLDWPYGDGDMVIENNERVIQDITLKNFGSGYGDTVVGRLRTADPSVTLYDTVVTFTGIELMATNQGDGQFSYSEANVLVDSWCWILFTDNYGRTFRHDFHIRPPDRPQDLGGDSSFGADVIVLTWSDMVDEGVRGYNLYRSLIPAGPFYKVNADLIDGSSYFRDEGLNLLTQYYYRATAVDSSLIEGYPSLMISQSTSPPEQAGFPLPFTLETSSHSAVGDVNGDGIREIILGSNEIYVWNAYGAELFDGDNNSQTHGPITGLETSFQPAGIALADLDGLPGLEIVACEQKWDSGVQNAVHIFRHDGTELPGWPQMLRTAGNGWAWTTPAIGDVDGDGEREIVLNTLDGRTWVWHIDGTELLDGDSDPTTNGVFIARPEANQEWGTSSPALFDLDGDGAREIIFGTKYTGIDNYLLAYRYDQTQAAGFPYTTDAGHITCSPTVADLNDDGIWEIIFASQNDWLHVVQQNGAVYSGFPIAFTANTGVMCPSPAVGDFDGDDELEIVAVSTQSGSLAFLYVIDTDIGGGTSGQTLAGWPQFLPGNSEGSPVVGDITGDGNLDIVHGVGGGSTESPNSLYAFRHNGALVPGFPISLGGPVRPCANLCDLDFDGDIEIIYGGYDLEIHVWDMPYAYDPLNVPFRTFRGHVTRDGVYRPSSLITTPIPTTGTELLLRQYPNPFNPVTQVELFIPGQAGSTPDLQVKIFDLRGRLVRQLHDGPVAAGWQRWTWDGRDQVGQQLASGMYFLRANLGDDFVIHKMSLLK